jgi:sterol desaturase/sphingolipid hydroxylase (fatty acid hydroxylase superfamily)
MDPQMHVLTDMRHHWLDSFISIPLIALPVSILFKFDEATAISIGGIIGFALGAWTTFCHANIRVRFGPASLLLNSPQLHRIHHSRLPEHHHRNFAAMFPIWDVIFGIYCAPAPHEYPPTGVEGETEVRSTLDAALLPFREWWKMLRRRRGTTSGL